MRKLLLCLFCIGMAFVGAYPSRAQYPDAESLLGRLGIKIDKDGKPVADGSGGFLPKVYDDLLERQTGKAPLKLTYLCNGTTAVRTYERDIIDGGYSFYDDFCKEVGILPDDEGVCEIGDLVRSREFLECVFGKDFISAFPKKTDDDKREADDVSVGSYIEFFEYDSLYKRYLACRKRLKELETQDENYKDYEIKRGDLVRCRGGCLTFYEEELKPCVEACGDLLERCVPRDKGREPLWKAWDVFRYPVPDRDPKDIRTAEDNFLRECSCVPGLEHYNHPVRTSFAKLQTLLPKFLEFTSAAFEASRAEKEALDRWDTRKTELKNKIAGGLLEEISEYRRRFKGRSKQISCDHPRHPNRVWLSTEPFLVDVSIYHCHYIGKDGTRKLYTEKWSKRVCDLRLELHLEVDVRTKKLLAAFCRGSFIVNDRVVTDFGKDGLCIFKKANDRAENPFLEYWKSFFFSD